VVNTIIGVGLFAAAVIAGMIANFQFMELTFEIDQHLPDGQKLNDTLWWTPLKHLRAWRLQKELLPSSRRARNFKLFISVAFFLFIAAIAVFIGEPF
jgi:hypothetical protein